MTLGILELVCTVGLIVPAAFHWKPALTVVASMVLAIESLVFVWVYVQYREIPPILLSGVLGLLMAFIAYGRLVLKHHLDVCAAAYGCYWTVRQVVGLPSGASDARAARCG